MSLQERAKKAYYIEEERREKELRRFKDSSNEEAYNQLIKIFPDLKYNESLGVFELAGYKFRARDTGIYINTGKFSYSLESLDNHHFWIYSLASLGAYILKKEKEASEPKHKPRKKRWFDFLS